MNPPARAKILDVLVKENREATIHADVNGAIKISKVRFWGENLRGLENSNLFQNGATYGFEYENYKSAIRNCVSKYLNGENVEVRERMFPRRMQKLLDKQYAIKHQ